MRVVLRMRDLPEPLAGVAWIATSPNDITDTIFLGYGYHRGATHLINGGCLPLDTRSWYNVHARA